MQKIFFILMVCAGLVSTPTGTPKVFANTELPSQQISKQDLVLVAARAVRDGKYELALRVSTTAIKLFPDYGTAYLYQGIAQYKLGKNEAAKQIFLVAKELYLNKLHSFDSEEKSEIKSGLNVIELHLKLIESAKKR